MYYLHISKEEWDQALEQLLSTYNIFAPLESEFGQDYEFIEAASIQNIIYNKPKPAAPLKSFFLPVKENVSSQPGSQKPRIIMGIPNCDIAGIGILDEIYLDKDFHDLFYSNRRDNTILIASDCIGILEHCHCSSYNINPYSTVIADMAVIKMENEIIIRVISAKGEELTRLIPHVQPLTGEGVISSVDAVHKATEELLQSANSRLPDYSRTGNLVKDAKSEIWEKYSSHCVSCGACTTICPTCTCFLLIDKPGFEKVKQLDACQYPGFERVAGGEDSLIDLHIRFRNRYMCKYVWKPSKFKSRACTGCGRCIEACIGKINKNELFMELV